MSIFNSLRALINIPSFYLQPSDFLKDKQCQWLVLNIACVGFILNQVFFWGWTIQWFTR